MPLGHHSAEMVGNSFSASPLTLAGIMQGFQGGVLCSAKSLGRPPLSDEAPIVPLSSPSGPSLLLSTGIQGWASCQAWEVVFLEALLSPLHSSLPPPSPVDKTYQHGCPPLKDPHPLPHLLFPFLTGHLE